jgi:DNA-binding beta-propeller fold protein YncE
MRLILRTLLMLSAAVATLHGHAGAQTSFVTFESAPVRPLALSPDGTRLFVCNIPDNALEIFDVDAGALTHLESVPVGMEPVAVATRTNTEVWVVNHLSDSVSIVDLSGVPRVTRTLLVGDEPNDIVFAGASGDRAFITTAHRGQNSPHPRGDYDVPGTGRADVWVFDAGNLGSGLGGTPLTVITLFGDKPRALASSPDGSTVYAAVYRSGNQTTTVHEGLVCDTSPANMAAEIVEGPCLFDDITIPGGYPPPHNNHEGIPRRETGLIVKLNRDGGTSDEWQDELGRDWSDVVRFDLPDLDVFAISADTNPPAETDAFAHAGTLLFNMVTHPVTGMLYVTNTEHPNHVRLEGPGTVASAIKPAGEPATVRGRLAEARVTVIDPIGGTVTPRHLNKHIDYSAVPQPAGVEDDSLSTPLGMALSADGNTLYVAAFGSGKIGVFDTTDLEGDTFSPDASTHISLSAGGPAGVIVSGTRLFTLTRFDNAVVEVDLTLGTVGAEIRSEPLHNPEPQHVINGRPFLYDAIGTGSNGEASCASCHPFGDMDDLAWDLGNPDDDVVENTNSILVSSPGVPNEFHPIKGPMATQSLRGMVSAGPQHWRGDRQGDANDAFNAFNVAFPGLVGRDEGEISTADMQDFTDFILELTYPPNPIRTLDNSLRPDEQAGADIFFATATDTTGNCNFCHPDSPQSGFFGTMGVSATQTSTEVFKNPHLRNLYQKIGMFGMPRAPRSPIIGVDYSHQGDQIRGFGFLHDGAFDTMFRFFRTNTFLLPLLPEPDIEAFMMAFDSDLPPMVGQQATKTSTSAAAVDTRIEAMITAAATPYPSKLLGPGAMQCDVIVKGVIAGEPVGGVLLSTGDIQPDDGGVAVPEATFRAFAATPGQELTYTCAPFGSGARMGIDRDEDGHSNRADNCPDVANPGQIDDNGNSIGDACEPGGSVTTTSTTTSSTTTTSTTTSTSTTTLPLLRDFTTRLLKIGRLTRPAGEQTVNLKSDDLDRAGVPVIPPNQTLTITLADGPTIVTSGTIAAGDPDWKASSSGTRFKWRARSNPHPAGLRSVSVNVNGPVMAFKVRMREADAGAAAGAIGLDVTLSLDSHVWTGPTPPCLTSGTGGAMQCR